MIIATPPENYTETKIYKELLAKSKASDGLAEKTTTFINTVRPLQEFIIAGPFADYTLHNPNHSKKLLHLSEYLIPEHTMKNMSTLDLTILIMSFYLHDLGMVVTQTERERIISSNDFQDYLQIKPEFGEKLNKLRSKLKEELTQTEILILETSLFQITEAALADYLRPLHATKERYNQLLKIIIDASGRNDLFSISGSSFENELIEVCISHNLNSSALIETNGVHQERFPRELIINGFSVNLQYCGAVLRLVDILDFDKERTPQSLFNSLGILNKALPGFDISLKEWNKHLAVTTISINSDEIVVSADSNHPSIEHSIREFCRIIENEIKDTQNVLKHNKTEILNIYNLNLPFIVRANIRSMGYTYKDYSIKLNETAIVKLLMGENLYSSSNAAIRELIQNSIDACDLLRKLTSENYDPLINVSTYEDSDSRFWLKITDNGIGMDEYVLSNFFFKVGNSYYSSTDFKRLIVKNQVENFVPISRFGIGLLSIFMIGEQIKVTTRNLNSPRKDTLQRTLLINSVDSLAVVMENEDGVQGTTIEVLLRKEKSDTQYIVKLFQFIKDTIIRPKVHIELTNLDKSLTHIHSDNYVKLNNRIKPELEKNNIEFIQIDLERFSDFVKGKAMFFFFKKSDGKLSYKDEKEELRWGNYPLKTSHLFENFLGGSRVTVNGITMGFKKIGSLYNLKKHQVASVLDVEIVGRMDVSYNVSRQKVFNSGLQVVKKELVTAIEKGLKESGIYTQFDDETISLFERKYTVNAIEDLSPKMVSKINSLLPNSSFPYTEIVYDEIAKQTNKNKYQVKKFITTMHFLGKIQPLKPD
jgi:molecular chaperone HtpG